jgi:hypothetical protein
MRSFLFFFFTLLACYTSAQENHRSPISESGRRYVYQGKRMSQNHLMFLLKRQDLEEPISHEIHLTRKLRKVQTGCMLLGALGVVEGWSFVFEYYATSLIPANPYFKPQPITNLYWGGGIMLGGLVAGLTAIPVRALRMKHARRVVELYNQGAMN